ncbi:MAG: hypothetical protein ACO3A2_09625 [Bdellovibrionia bacterium]
MQALSGSSIGSRCSNFMRKTRLFHVWPCLSLFLISSSGLAVDEVTELRKALENLEKGYSVMVNHSYDSIVQGYTHQRFYDFYKIFFYELESLNSSKERYTQWVNRLNHLSEKIDQSRLSISEQAIEIRALQASLEYERERVEKIAMDLREFQTLWQNRCSKERIQAIHQQFYPTAFFSVDQKPRVEPEKSTFKISVSYKTDISGDGPGQVSGGIESSRDGSERHIVGLASAYVTNVLVTAAQTKTKLTLGVLLSGKLSSVVGWFAGGAVWLGVSLVFAGIDELISTLKANEIADLRIKMHQTQREVLDDLVAKSKGRVQEACDSILKFSFPVASSIQSSEDYLSELEVSKIQLDEMWEHLLSQYRSQWIELQSRIYPQVKQRSLEFLNRYFVSVRETRQEIQSWIETRITPHLERIHLLEGPVFIQKLEAQHQLWDQIILGDIEFNTGDHPPHVLRRWTAWLEEIKSTLVP